MFTRMKKVNKRLRTLRYFQVRNLQKGLIGLILGSVLNEFWFSKRTGLIVQARTLTGSVLNGSFSSKRTDPTEFMVFSPSSKLSPGLSNQPKVSIYPFWQSQSQIANLSPIL